MPFLRLPPPHWWLWGYWNPCCHGTPGGYWWTNSSSENRGYHLCKQRSHGLQSLFTKVSLNSMASPFTIYSKNKIYRKIIEISPILKRYLCTRERYLFMLERYLFDKKRYLFKLKRYLFKPKIYLFKLKRYLSK
jgi:hypothetical protein